MSRQSRLAIGAAAIGASTVTSPTIDQTPEAPRALPSDEAITQAYIYLLGRLMVARQQQLDFQEGFEWNQLVHRRPGEVEWPNPNLDVAYSEAWLNLDETSCSILTVPDISGRYYTVQILNGWGETLANINERLFPEQPSGDFAICLLGAQLKLPVGVRRIDLPVKTARVLARVALDDDWDGAIALQHQFRLSATGAPEAPTVPKTPVFELENLPGVDAFDVAAAALEEPDLNPGLEALQETARQVAEAIADPKQRTRVDDVIRSKAFAEIARAGATIGHGTVRNGWTLPGVVGQYGIDYLTRSLVNYRGIWANIKPEVLYYRGAMDGDGLPLNGDHCYSLTFPPDALPARFSSYFWSVIAVDAKRFHVLPTPLKKYLLNEQSGLEYGTDGSLTLHFGPEKPVDAPESNWLPTPRGTEYRLTFRFYGPIDGVANQTYYPPPLVRT